MITLVFMGGAFVGCFLGVAIMALADLLSDIEEDEIGIELGQNDD